MSLNLHRRHLTSGQRAVLALEVEPFFAEEAKERMKAGAESTNTGKGKIPYPEDEKGQARDQAAQATGTNGRYVSDVKKIKHDAPQVFEQVKSGELNISQAKQKIKGKHNVHFSNKTTEHITPAHIIGKVIQLFGVIDLDPCSNDGNTPNVLATYHFTEDDNGLLQSWNGRIYINPPYGRELPLWTDKGLKEYRSGNILEAIFLIPSCTELDSPLYILSSSIIATGKRSHHNKSSSYEKKTSTSHLPL